MDRILTDAERRRISTGAEQAREDFEESGLASARRAHRDLMKLLAADDDLRSRQQTGDPS